MINKRAIDDFLSRQLDDFDWVKKLTHQDVNSSLNSLISDDITKGLWLHQKAQALILLHQPRFLLFTDPGGGKTRTILSLIRHRKLMGESPKVVVFTPSIASIDTWLNEAAEFAPELGTLALIYDSETNRSYVQPNDLVDIVIVCYQSAVAMTTLKPKGQWVLDPVLLEECFGHIDAIVMDEVHRCKSSKSLTYQMCLLISKKAEYSYGLTGTPFGSDLQDLWPEYNLIDLGETLGPSLNFYRSVFFTIKKGFWGGAEFKFKKRLMPHLQRMIRNKSIRYTKNEFADLPPVVPIYKNLSLPSGIKGYVDKALIDLRKAVTGSDYTVAGNSYIQLQQLSSGFITFKGEEDQRVKVKFDDNPKLDILADILAEMPIDDKMVVFHNFIYTNELISNKLKDMKIQHARIWGGQKDQLGELRRFREDKKCRVMILNTRSGSSSLNLQFASYLVFFEQPPSAIERRQCEDRVHRPGQTQRVMMYDLFVTGTYDKRIWLANKEGRDLLKLILDKNQEV